MTSEIITSAAVTPRAIASRRHSRRTANQIRPTPGVTLVRITKAQVAGQRKPSTIAAAISRWPSPWYSSSATGGKARTTRLEHQPSQIMVATRTAVHSHKRLYQGSAANGRTAGRSPGV